MRAVVGFSMDQEVFRGPASALHPLFPPETNAASSASRRSCHLLVTSERDRSSLGEDELGQGWGKPPPGERYEGACVGVGIYLGGEVCQAGRLMGSITEDHTGKVKSPWGAGSHPVSMPSAREKKHKGAQGEGVWKAEKEETARTTLLRPSNTSKGITESASKAITFQAGSWSLQKANGPKNRVPASLTGGSWRRHCTAPISPGVTKEGEQQSFWHPPEEVRRGRAALPQHPPPAQGSWEWGSAPWY